MNNLITIISESQNFSVNALKDKLTGLGYTVSFSETKIDSVSKIDTETGTIIILLNQDLSDNLQILTYLKDFTSEHDIPIFLEGNPDEIADVAKLLPKHLLQDSLIRPIDAVAASEKIDEFMKYANLNHKKKILVIDDSGAYLRNVKGWLEDKYQVIPANSGIMGIKYLSTNRPDLILLDYEMPVCDGRQVLDMIRNDSDLASIPVIFLTGKDDAQSVMQVMSLKPEGYLLKSLPSADIIKAIDDFFNKQRISVLK